MVTCTLKLGISILNGGNVQVQQVCIFVCLFVCLFCPLLLSLIYMLDFFSHVQKMLDYLKEKRDAGFFKSLSGLMQSCRY